MSERDRILRRIGLLEELLELHRRLDSMSPQPVQAPPPQAQAQQYPQPPKGEVVARIAVPVVQGPNGAAAPVVDLSQIAHLVQGGPDALAALQRQIADVISQIPPDVQPGTYGVATVR